MCTRKHREEEDSETDGEGNADGRMIKKKRDREVMWRQDEVGY